MFKPDNIRKNFMRAKQTVDQNLGRSEKSEVLSEDLQSVEKRVDLVKEVSQRTTKKIEGWLKTSSSSDVEKRLKKMPETGLALSMIESANLLGSETLMGTLYQQCGECQSNLASLTLSHDLAVEKDVLQPLQDILDNEIPAINKLKKHLNKATLDMDSLKSRWDQAVKQTRVHGTNMVQAANKADTMKEHYEDSCARMQQARDTLTTEMYNFIAREPEHSQKLLSLLEIQQDYHKKALEEIAKIIPRMKDSLECNPHKPCYGVPLEEHLRVTERDVALVIEACIVTIIEGGGMEEEGLFRIAGMASKVKKLKTSFDAGVVDMDEYALDIHSVAGALKQYLRELPEPLLTYTLYPEFMKVLSLAQNQRLQALWKVVHDLPEANYVNFRYLVKFLAKLTEKSDINKMTPSNIAIVIGPNLLWQEGDPGASMASSGSVSNLLEMIVSNADWFFPEAIDFHQGRKGSAPPRLSSSGEIDTTTATVSPMQASNNQSFIGKACEIVTTTAAGPITSHQTVDGLNESDVFTDNVPPSYQSMYGLEQPAEISAQSSNPSAEVEFGNMSSFCSPNSSRMSDNFDMMDQEEALGGAPPPQEEQKSPSQPIHKSESGGSLSAPISEIEPISPKSHRKQKLKPAPPPPPDRPYSIAVTASYSKNAEQCQTWPRGVKPESNEEKPRVKSPDKPPLADKPGNPPQRSATIAHGDRPTGPPPDRPSKPPPAVPTHQRSASTGNANNVAPITPVTSEQNGQDETKTGTL